MNVGYFKNQTFKAQDGKEIKFIGGIWNAVSNDGKTNYFRGHIETPLVAGGRVYLALFSPKEPNGLMFEATWSAPKRNNSSHTLQASESASDEIDVSQYCDSDEIPF